MRGSRGGLLLVLFGATAVLAGAAAVGQHNACTAAGYKLAEARREHVRLDRSIAAAQQRLAALRAPAATLARAAAMGLDLTYPVPVERPRALVAIEEGHE